MHAIHASRRDSVARSMKRRALMSEPVAERQSAPPVQLPPAAMIGGDPPEPRSIADMVTHLRLSHHVTTRVLLCRVEVAIVGAVEPRRDDALGLRVRQAFGKLRSELIAHMAGEERSVFPYVRAIDAADRRLGHPPVEAFGASSPLRLATERAGAEDILVRDLLALQATMRLDATHEWEPAVAALRELHVDLVEHIRFENDELFPRAVEAERRVLTRAMTP